MQITITDKGVVQAVRHFLTHKLIYTPPNTPIANLSDIQDILLYAESVHLDFYQENMCIEVYLATSLARTRANYKVLTVHQYKSYGNQYPQQLKPLLSFILNNIQKSIINQYSIDLATACTTTLDNTHNKEVVNSVPKMY